MFDYILQNKAWIFSGIGVLAISALAALLRYAIRRQRLRSNPGGFKTVKAAIEAQPPPPVHPPGSVEPLTPAQVAARAEATPLLQRPDFLLHLVGAPIEFSGELLWDCPVPC